MFRAANNDKQIKSSSSEGDDVGDQIRIGPQRLGPFGLVQRRPHIAESPWAVFIGWSFGL